MLCGEMAEDFNCPVLNAKGLSKMEVLRFSRDIKDLNRSTKKALINE